MGGVRELHLLFVSQQQQHLSLITFSLSLASAVVLRSRDRSFPGSRLLHPRCMGDVTRDSSASLVSISP